MSTDKAVAHTPGPWSIVDAGMRGVDCVSANGRIVFSTAPMPECNARLIAAAPDLLAALRDFALLTEEGDDRLSGAYHARDGHIRAKGSLLESIERARAAIAKATES